MDENNQDSQPDSSEENFADLFEQSFTAQERLSPGDKISAQIVKITPEWIFIDLGGKSEGSIDAREFQDESGVITVSEGDKVSAYFLSASHGEQTFSTKLSTGSSTPEFLEEAQHSGIPVEGTVEQEIKGGYEVKISGSHRAFCPFSQMGLRKIEDPTALIGQKLTFKITSYQENGRNIIVSHRAVLEEERLELKEDLKKTLQEGMTVTGTISALRDFGAFVDLGGIDGLIPMSELGWSRVERTSDVLSPDQQVEVKVLAIDWDRERISLSLKACLPDPWDTAANDFAQGSTHTGTIARMTKFGAFVTLAPGIDGLVHISKLGRGKGQSNELQPGTQIGVVVQEFDLEKRRIALAPAEDGGETLEDKTQSAALHKKYVRSGTGSTSSTGSLGTLGDLLREKMKQKK